MKLLVAVKRVIDYNVKPRVKMDGSGVDLANVKMSMNPFDEIAVEEAIRLKEKGAATEVVVVLDRPGQGAGNAAHRAGDGRRPRHPRHQRRRGRAARRRQDPARPSPTRNSPGWSSSASRRSTTTATRSGRCSPPCSAGRRAPSPSKVEVAGDSVNVTREVDGGLETLKLATPAIVTTDLRLNEPRYASLPNIMKAKSKPLANKTAGRFRRRHRAAAARR